MTKNTQKPGLASLLINSCICNASSRFENTWARKNPRQTRRISRVFLLTFEGLVFVSLTRAEKLSWSLHKSFLLAIMVPWRQTRSNVIGIARTICVWKRNQVAAAACSFFQVTKRSLLLRYSSKPSIKLCKVEYYWKELPSRYPYQELIMIPLVGPPRSMSNNGSQKFF